MPCDTHSTAHSQSPLESTSHHASLRNLARRAPSTDPSTTRMGPITALPSPIDPANPIFLALPGGPARGIWISSAGSHLGRWPLSRLVIASSILVGLQSLVRFFCLEAKRNTRSREGKYQPGPQRILNYALMTSWFFPFLGAGASFAKTRSLWVFLTSFSLLVIIRTEQQSACSQTADMFKITSLQRLSFDHPISTPYSGPFLGSGDETAGGEAGG
ncbi:hypothetical protein BD289DRAFT_436115 [Coniella lustricola]|uniref:Uncharacterized protein n=1 Tax=Coniella lustricola TaxID=2025994 RepID=A0A2T3A5I5_9PEZI|nr:hypothetical protein BD289DRAFT_436115 [Coniella lustricola]